MVGSALGDLVGCATVLVEGHVTGNSFFSIEKVPEARSGGTTQAETRVYNERLVLSLVRRHGQLSKVDLTRLTGLAPQTITTIVNRAADSQLLVRREALRGRLGQPSVPYALNAAAAYSFGLKVDHRSADVALINFVGEVLALEQTTFDYPMPDEVMHFAKSATARICRKHKSISRDRIAGLGIASPFYQSNWEDEIGAPASRFDAWRKIDIRAELDDHFEWPVYLFNDATVSASAELMFGSGLGRPTFSTSILATTSVVDSYWTTISSLGETGSPVQLATSWSVSRAGRAIESFP